jgi:hypothetical protein
MSTREKVCAACWPHGSRADRQLGGPDVLDLPRLAGLSPAGVICEIMNEDGSMGPGA